LTNLRHVLAVLANYLPPVVTSSARLFGRESVRPTLSVRRFPSERGDRSMLLRGHRCEPPTPFQTHFSGVGHRLFRGRMHHGLVLAKLECLLRRDSAAKGGCTAWAASMLNEAPLAIVLDAVECKRAP
jgi:hypothetical protein